MNDPADSVHEIATLRIELLDSEPLIWRQLEVPTSITLKALHDTVQAAMGWFDAHLWEFTIGETRYGPPAADDGWGAIKPINATKVRLRDVLKPGKTAIGYVYDFGDTWEHRLTITNTRTGDPTIAYPRFIAGEEACPPEDCGGMPGFYDFLDAIADPSHPNHADTLDWCGGRYDPKDIDEEQIKISLNRIAKRRRAAQTRRKQKTI